MQNNEGPHAARQRIFHRLFIIGIWLKGMDGFIELASGLLILIASPHALNHCIVVIIRHELERDSGHLFVAALRHIASHLTIDSKLTAGAYLAGNGVVKIFLAGGILRGKLWCYPTAVVVISLFVLLQCGRLFFRFSFPLLIGSFIDIAIVLLIWREYRQLKRH